MCRIGGRLRTVTVRLQGVVGEIPPLLVRIPNPRRHPVWGPCQAGSLTGAVAS